MDSRKRKPNSAFSSCSLILVSYTLLTRSIVATATARAGTRRSSSGQCGARRRRSTMAAAEGFGLTRELAKGEGDRSRGFYLCRLSGSHVRQRSAGATASRARDIRSVPSGTGGGPTTRSRYVQTAKTFSTLTMISPVVLLDELLHTQTPTSALASSTVSSHVVLWYTHALQSPTYTVRSCTPCPAQPNPAQPVDGRSIPTYLISLEPSYSQPW